jgi:hypothetical protein
MDQLVQTGLGKMETRHILDGETRWAVTSMLNDLCGPKCNNYSSPCILFLEICPTQTEVVVPKS